MDEIGFVPRALFGERERERERERDRKRGLILQFYPYEIFR